jgi:hypothetical protein
MIYSLSKRQGKLVQRIAFLIIAVLVITGCNSTEDVTVTNGKQIELFFDSAETQHPLASVDLDTAQISNSPESDLTLVVSGGTMLINTLQAINGAKAGIIGLGSVSQDKCLESANKLSDRNIPDFRLNSILCVLTNKGQFVRAHVDRIENPRKGATQVTITVIRTAKDEADNYHNVW